MRRALVAALLLGIALAVAPVVPGAPAPDASAAITTIYCVDHEDAGDMSEWTLAPGTAPVGPGGLFTYAECEPNPFNNPAGVAVPIGAWTSSGTPPSSFECMPEGGTPSYQAVLNWCQQWDNVIAAELGMQVVQYFDQLPGYQPGGGEINTTQTIPGEEIDFGADWVASNWWTVADDPAPGTTWPNLGVGSTALSQFAGASNYTTTPTAGQLLGTGDGLVASGLATLGANPFSVVVGAHITSSTKSMLFGSVGYFLFGRNADGSGFMRIYDSGLANYDCNIGAASAIPLNERVAVLLTYNAGLATMYVNGTSIGSCSPGGTINPSPPNSLIVGIANDGASFSTTGVITHVGTFARTLTAPEIAEVSGFVETGTTPDIEIPPLGAPREVPALEPTPTTSIPVADTIPGGVTPSTTTDKTLGDRIGGFITGLGNRIVDGVKWLGSSIAEGLVTLGNQLVNKLQAVYNGLSTLLQLGWSYLVDGFQGMYAWLGYAVAWLADIATQLGTLALSIVEPIVSAITALPEAIAAAFAWVFEPPTLPALALDMPDVDCADTFPCSWFAEVGTALDTVGNEIETGTGGGVCGPTIGWDDYSIRLPAPSSTGCPGNGDAGSRLDADDQAGDLLGYRSLARAVLTFFLYLGFMVQLVKVAPWTDDQVPTPGEGVAA